MEETVFGSSRESSRRMRFVFVGGSARSGTTLVQKILCAHSLISGGPEFDHMLPLMQMYDRMRQPTRLDRQAWYYSEAELGDCMRSFVLSLFANMRKKYPTAEIISEKTPSNIAAARPLLELFPDSKFINVQRDGRDMLYSHKKVRDRFVREHGRNSKPWIGEFKTSLVCTRWKQNAEQARQVEQHSPKEIRDRFMTVKYEHLVADPPAEIERICSFIGIAPESLMLSPERIDPVETGQIANIDNVWYTKAQFSQEFNTNSIGRWKQGLSFMDRFSANLRMAPELIRLGYEVPDIYKRLRKAMDLIRRRR